MAHFRHHHFKGETVVFSGIDTYEACRFIRCKLIVRPHPLAPDDAALIPGGENIFVDNVYSLDLTINTIARWETLRACFPFFVPPRPADTHRRLRGRFYRPGWMRRRIEEGGSER